MLVFPKHKKVFIAIPKTGSTSIIFSGNKNYLNFKPEIYHSKSSETKLLIQNNREDFFNFIGEDTISSDDYKVILDNVDNYLTCAVIRNPIDRIRSFFCELHDGLHTDNFGLRKFSPYEVMDYIIGSDDCSLPIHIKPQYLFLDRFKSIHLFPFERLDSCWNMFYGNLLKEKIFTHQRSTRKFKMKTIFDQFLTENKILIHKIKLRYSRDYKIHSLLLDHTLVSNNKAIQLLKR